MVGESKKVLKNLYGLRFLAATYVIVFHYWSLPHNDFLNAFFSHGHMSVPFFFLLSGFVLSYSYETYDFSSWKAKKRYLLSRFFRLGPVYYSAMFLAVVLIVVRALKGSNLGVEEHFFYSAAHLIMVQSLLPFKKLMSYWNSHSWSISVELFLYGTSIFLIPWVRKIQSKGLLLLFVLSTAINYLIFLLALEEPIAHFSPLYIPTFVSGIILANVYFRFSQSIEKYAMAGFFVTAAILLSLLFAGLEKNIYSSFNPVFHLSFSLLILFSSFENKGNSFLGSRAMIYLGEISYAMYILQAPIKFFTQQFLSKVLGYQAYNGHIFNFSILISIIICSALLTSIIDKKMQKYLRQKYL